MSEFKEQSKHRELFCKEYGHAWYGRGSELFPDTLNPTRKYSDWLEKRLEEAERELKKVLKEHSLLLGLLCEIRLAYQGVGDFESTGENMVALIPRIDLVLGLKHPGTETPDPDEDPGARKP